MPNMGSFGMGNQQMSQAVGIAMQARQGQGTPVPQLSQTGQGAPAIPPSMPTTQAMPQGMEQPPQGAPQATQSPMMAPNAPESELIIKALSQRLQAISSVEKSEVEGVSAPVGG